MCPTPLTRRPDPRFPTDTLSCTYTTVLPVAAGSLKQCSRRGAVVAPGVVTGAVTPHPARASSPPPPALYRATRRDYVTGRYRAVTPRVGGASGRRRTPSRRDIVRITHRRHPCSVYTSSSTWYSDCLHSLTITISASGNVAVSVNRWNSRSTLTMCN